MHAHELRAAHHHAEDLVEQRVVPALADVAHDDEFRALRIFRKLRETVLHGIADDEMAAGPSRLLEVVAGGGHRREDFTVAHLETERNHLAPQVLRRPRAGVRDETKGNVLFAQTLQHGIRAGNEGVAHVEHAVHVQHQSLDVAQIAHCFAVFAGSAAHYLQGWHRSFLRRTLQFQLHFPAWR